jgi:hypothetical protein
MTVVPALLTPAALLEHALASARADELRHCEDGSDAEMRCHSEGTLRGWGNGALTDLEWTSFHTYSRAQHQDYRQTYAREYLRIRVARMQARAG